MKNRKGDMFDLIYVLPMLLGIAIVLFMGAYLTNILHTELGAMGLDTSGTASAITAFGILDYMVPMFFISTLIATIILAWYIETNPLFFGVAMIFWIIATILAAVQSDVFVNFAETAAIAPTSATFTVTMFMMRNLPVFIVIGISAVAIVLYGKWRLG